MSSDLSMSVPWDYGMYWSNSVPYPSHYLPSPLNSPVFPSTQSMHSGQVNCEGKKMRRYKTPSPQILRVRRSAANERERRRMNTLNVAYDENIQLRTVLPEMDSGRRLSKFETLQMAQQYIECLADILKKNAAAKQELQ